MFVDALALVLLGWLLPGLRIDSFWSAVGAVLAYLLAQTAFALIFVSYVARLPAILYPVLTFALSSALVVIGGNLIPGINIGNIGAGIWIVLVLTLANSVLGVILAIDEDAVFDRFVTGRMVKQHGEPVRTTVPGFIFLEIDGLGEAVLRQAIEHGHMPTLQAWLQSGTHRILGWETDFSSQTGAMQTGILLGSNDDVPGYRWWDRSRQQIVMSGDPRDALRLERRLSSGKGLLAKGGASRANMFSGDASESILTISTVLDRSRPIGPGFYFYLFNPYVVVRLAAHFVREILKEWVERWQQIRRKDKYIVKVRNAGYALFRAFMGPLMQDLATYATISDALRGVPAVYALYAGYDDLGHFAGMNSPECFRALHETDRYFARIQRAVAFAPRPYHLVVLSDHGQSLGPTFESAYGVGLEGLVDALIAGAGDVYLAQGTDETRAKIQVALTESINADTRTASVLRRMLRSRTKGGRVEVPAERERSEAASAKKAIVLASGSAGLVYFTGVARRMSYEQIQATYPDLILGLVQHPGIGFVLVDSAEHGPMAMGRQGIHFLADGKIEGADPLAVFGRNAAMHLKRHAGFSNAPDLLLNTTYDPDTQELPGFENQVGHHGGLGGPQCHPFLVYPSTFPVREEPIVTAVSLHNLLHGWRDSVQPPNS